MGEQQKLNEFEPATYQAWLELVERDLQGAPFEKKLVKRVAGLDIQPLYTRAQTKPDAAGLPGFAPFTRGAWALGAVEMGWDVRQAISHADPRAAARAILDDLNGGATGISLELDRATRAGSDEHGVGGVALANLDDLETTLEHVSLERVPVSLAAGVSALPLAAGLVALANKRGVKLAALHGCFGADPLSTLATHGSLPTSLEGALRDTAELAKWASANTPHVSAVMVGTSPYHDAGADAAAEIGIALASGLAYLRALTAAGLSIDAAAKQLVFGFSIGRDFFVEIAKLRAARRAWAKVVAACGGSAEAQAMVIHARTSFRTKTQRDPWVNLLRATAETFSAAAGGADMITTSGFDEALGESDDFARRLARNTQHLLRHEASVGRVVDPAGGSWYIESITEELAKHGWEKLQHIERAGGMAEALKKGTLQTLLAASLDADRKAVETRKLSITGVNEFPNVKEEKVMRARGEARAAAERVQKAHKGVAALTPGKLVEQAIDAIAKGAAFADVTAALQSGEPAKCAALKQERLAQPFESLRDLADALLAKHGRRATVFLANLGPIPEHKARAGFAQNYFEAGGFAVLTNDGFQTADEAAGAFARSGADIACLCSSDGVYAELAESAAKAIAAKKPKAIALAGNPGDKEAAYKAAGVTDFIFVGTNVAQSLRSLLGRAGAV